MRYWPVPDSFSTEIPVGDSLGAFWQDRGHCFHCGVDLFAPAGSAVVAIQDGIVEDSGLFTGHDLAPYWNESFYILVRHAPGMFVKYAELDSEILSPGTEVQAGGKLGTLVETLDLSKVSESSPDYIQKYADLSQQAMLHIELYERKPNVDYFFLGGSAFHGIRPRHLVDPTPLLQSIAAKLEGK